jgi:MoaA/NifB/PqqE/SkfB family radical SAM enzyme
MSLFSDFYGKQNTLEVCLILFDKCNLHCKFCFENHTKIISTEEIVDISNKLIPQLEEVIVKRPYLNRFVFRLWGGELFMDGINDDYFTAYNKLIDNIRTWCKSNNYECEFCFSSNLVFVKTDRVIDFLKQNEKDTYIATSYDPVARFHTQVIEDIWWKNTELFNPKVISITLTKPAIEKYITTDILTKLSKWELYPEYYIYNKDWQIYAPSGEELFEFFKYCYENEINIPELKSIINNYNTKTGNRYCYCFNSCSFINGKLVFSCLLRSGTMSMLPEYGMTLEECYDNDNVTEKQFNIATSRLKCFSCKYYKFCRLPCMASRMHKESENTKCHLKLFYDWLSNVNKV